MEKAQRKIQHSFGRHAENRKAKAQRPAVIYTDPEGIPHEIDVIDLDTTYRSKSALSKDIAWRLSGDTNISKYYFRLLPLRIVFDDKSQTRISLS